MEKIKVTVRKHTWLDYSVSWFIEINGQKFGGEIYSESKAIEEAKGMAENIGGIYDDEIHSTNEMF